MKRILLVAMAILLLAGVAFGGATAVYTGATALFSGTSNGVSTSFVNGVASAGDTTAVTVPAGSTLRLMRMDFKPDADMTGVVNIKIGSTVVYAIKNAVADNVYGKNLSPNFNIGSAGDDLIINTSALVRYNIDYRVD
jgi:hypothetical protein